MEEEVGADGGRMATTLVLEEEQTGGAESVQVQQWLPGSSQDSMEIDRFLTGISPRPSISLALGSSSCCCGLARLSLLDTVVEAWGSLGSCSIRRQAEQRSREGRGGDKKEGGEEVGGKRRRREVLILVPSIRNDCSLRWRDVLLLMGCIALLFLNELLTLWVADSRACWASNWACMLNDGCDTGKLHVRDRCRSIATCCRLQWALQLLMAGASCMLTLLRAARAHGSPCRKSVCVELPIG
ncbi:hypothetical protein Dimus_030191 [Dionaea muscipula]